jgi:tetratricopeptide (TPR) repeat protein
MEQSTDALVARFKKAPNVQFTPEEAALLAAAAGRDLWAAKAASLHYCKARDFPRALALMKQIAQRQPTDESICNVAIIYRDTKQYAECIAWLKANSKNVDPIRFQDLLCSSYAHLGDRVAAIGHGDEALRLKDVNAGIQPTHQAYVVKPFNPETPRRNVISFSIWGADPRYLRGAINNAIVARYLYPGWVARFYTDASTPADFRAALQQNAAEVVLMPDMPAKDYGLCWRFLVEDDENVDIYLVRDADSVLNVKERVAVADWLNSGKAFHVMRDDLQHCELILAGMWGAHRGNVKDMRSKIVRYNESLPNIANFVHKDQHFLRRVVWPIARGSAKIHDRHFSFMNPDRYDPSYELPAQLHIGQNDWVHYRKTQADAGPHG